MREGDNNHLAVDSILGINEVAHVLARLLACPDTASFGLSECCRMSFHELEAIKISLLLELIFKYRSQTMLWKQIHESRICEAR